jgi:hypothetical protein
VLRDALQVRTWPTSLDERENRTDGTEKKRPSELAKEDAPYSLSGTGTLNPLRVVETRL